MLDASIAIVGAALIILARRARFTATEIVQLTLNFYKRNYIEGLFLSSGIIGSSNYTMEQMVEVARCLREDHDFRGYIHLKTIPGATRRDAPDGDPVEETWKTYYASIFNPARVKVKAMTKEMPKKYWKNMPETALIGELLAGAQKREAAMIETSRSQPAVGRSNAEASWAALREEAAVCTRRNLHRCATQTVFGEGPLDAKIFFVGEQPGDREDLAGHPFVGRAGEVFDAALEEAGIDRATTYVTNAVKHFKFVPRGKKRIHARPDVSEIDACRWWQEQERGLIQPTLTVALGATAARSLTRKTVTISKVRDAPLMLADGSECWVTVHPSFLLRIPDADARCTEREHFVDDLRRIRKRIEQLAA